MPERRPNRLAILLAVSVLSGVLPSSVAAQAPSASPAAVPSAEVETEPVTTGAGEPAGEILPSVHYEDALAHADDVIEFQPGERATVAFQPRADDTSTVGGEPSRALPAGRTSGAALADQETGETTVASTEIVETEAPSLMTTAETDSTGGTTAVRKEVFGFLPYWELSNSSLTLDYSALTTIAYFGVGASSSGSLIKRNSDGTVSTGWAGWTSSRMTSILNTAHQNGVRVVLTIERFSWTSGQIDATTTLLSSSTNRQRLANEIAVAVRDRGADGVNLDFEPIPSGQGANFVDLTRRVRAALDAQAPGYQLTLDTTGYIGNYRVAELTAPGAADAIFIMGYDYRIGSASRAGSIAPLAGPTYDLTDTVKAFLNYTTPNKIILGLPYYGRAWTTQTSDLNSYTYPQGSTYGYSGTVLYRYAVGTAAQYGRRWDSTEASAWTAYQRRNCSSCPLAWRQLYYDDVTSLGLKYDMVNRLGLRGTGMWALGYDGTRPELYSLLKQKFPGTSTTIPSPTPTPTPSPTPTPTPRAGIRLLPATTPSEGVYVDWVATAPAGFAGYDVQVSVNGGGWTAWKTGTGSGAATYLGRAGYNYAFRVRARDKTGAYSPWNVSSTWTATPALAPGGFARVEASSTPLRSAADLEATAVRTATRGQILAIAEGPVSADGYRWYRVTGPLTEWGVVSTTVSRNLWVAAGPSTAPWIAPAQSPNATALRSEVSRLAVGSVDTVTHTSATSPRVEPTGSRSFSPNGDRIHDALRVSYHVSHTLESLTMRVYSASTRALLGSVKLPGLAGGGHTFDWNGHFGSTRVADGPILVQLVGVKGGVSYTTPAANMADPTLPVASLAVTVDTVAPTVSVPKAAAPTFSPNGDGVLDSTSVSATATGGAATWQLTISTSSTMLRSFSGTGGTMAGSWDGRDASGVRVPDGAYRLRAVAVDAVGNTATTYRWLWVDTTAPSGTLPVTVPGADASQTAAMFSPNGDGRSDTARLGWALNEVASGRLSVQLGTTVVYSAPIPSGSSGSIAWDGRDANGLPVPDGAYTLAANVSDRVGNKRSVAGSVVVDRTVGFFRPSRQFFHPTDGDALAATTTLSFRLTAPARSILRVYSGTTLVRTAWYGVAHEAGTPTWTWNGRNDAGAYVKPGIYRAVLHVARNGIRHALSYTLRVDAFAITASPAPVAAGQTLTVVASSSEPLSTTPTVTLTQAGLAPVSRTATARSDGRWQATFTVASGGSGTATISVAARDTLGGTNRTSTTVVVR